MGAGKTSGVRSLAAQLDCQPLDSDHELERELGESIESFYDREGEHAFRAREEEAVLALLAREDTNVIALGGGALESDRVREALQRHLVVHLEVDPEEAWRRASGKGRPLARDPGRFKELYEQRRPVYDSIADAVLPPADRGAPLRALPALDALRSAPSGTRLVWARTGSRDYPVFFGRGLIASGFFFPSGGRRFVVTDETVAGLVPVEADAAIKAGEAAKNLLSAEWVLRRMAVAGMGHDDVVAAVGGGVVGDLAGFCAAVYQRGVGHVQVPTTLVAQVDSAYGGKTGVDLPEGKNYVGAYHQPRAVLADPRVLETLPAEELAAGWAEVIKTALIAGGALWARVRRADGAVDRDLILACARTKLAVVARDERDAGRRQVLNLGHTVGHAIETATGYRRYRHGEAVALGLLAALTLSGPPQLRAQGSDPLEGLGLPTKADSDLDVEAVLDAVQRDKKKRGGRVGFVLVEAPGDVRTGAPVSERDVRAALGGLL